ncbi:MAG: hypothetical protein KID08_25290 [Pseudomonas putida]|nr:hypothetical protein [Pseudomonas putida]MBS5849007.1 hypothetical protein [Pseudomonas putida]HDS1008256.1 hypothetical protein [Pseudomonas putida]
MKYPARHLLPSAEGEHVSRPNASWALTTLLALSLALTAGCSSKGSKARYATPAVGSNCFAKAVPTTGEGGLAWGNTLSIARQKSMNNCIRYAGRSGGAPQTCQVVMAKCKN